jgi:hypothetical protein
MRRYLSFNLVVLSDDPDLTEWAKVPGAFLPEPSKDLDLMGWRDPFVLERPTADQPYWVVMVGAGFKGAKRAGTALVYRSKGSSLQSGEP